MTWGKTTWLWVWPKTNERTGRGQGEKRLGVAREELGLGGTREDGLGVARLERGLDVVRENKSNFAELYCLSTLTYFHSFRHLRKVLLIKWNLPNTKCSVIFLYFLQEYAQTV